MKTSEKVYWIKVALGAVTGLICFYANRALGVESQLAFMVGTILFILYSEALALYTHMDRNRVLRIAIGGFLFVWMFTWTLLNTLWVHNWI